MERPSLSSGPKIRQEEENLHREAESCGTEKANYHCRESALAPRPLEARVLLELPGLDCALRPTPRKSPQRWKIR